MAEVKEELCGKKCAKCKYHGRVGSHSKIISSTIICEYILQGLGRRNCSIEHCDKYEPINGTKRKGEKK